MRNKRSTIFIVLILLVVLNIQTTLAADATQVNFSVKAKIPDNQIDKEQTYFDLKMEPSAKQTIEVEIFNNAKETIEVSVAANSASTNQGGVIEYNMPVQKDESLLYDFADIVHVETPKIVLESGTSKVAQISLTMPDSEFDGILLGGIVITKLENTTAASTPTNAQNVSTGITNEYAYVIGVSLSETDKIVEPDLKLKHIEPKLINYKTAIVANLQNDQAAIAKGISINAKIYEQGGETPVKEIDKSNISMAPNSNFDFIIDWDNAPIKSGNYRLLMTATLGEKNWEWDENFSIDSTESDTINNEAIALKSDNRMWIYAGSAVILVLVAIIAYLVISMRKRD